MRSLTRFRGRRVALALALLFLGLEGFTRTALYDMSKDLRRFRTYPARAGELAGRPGFRVALIGNSATDRGVDPEILRRGLEAASGSPVSVDLFVADQSRINTWHYMLERYFWRPGHRPDLVVVTFYENDLEDGNPVEVGRLAQFFTTVRDWPEVFRTDLPSLHDRMEFLISAGWATFAARERIRERVLKLAIPGYEAEAGRMNAVLFRHARGGGGPAAHSGRALERLLRRGREAGTPLCFVAYPTLPEGPAAPYEVAPATREAIRGAGMAYLDLRRLPELSADRYADDVHLTEAGRTLYSRSLAEAVAPLVSAGRTAGAAAGSGATQPHP